MGDLLVQGYLYSSCPLKPKALVNPMQSSMFWKNYANKENQNMTVAILFILIKIKACIHKAKRLSFFIIQNPAH